MLKEYLEIIDIFDRITCDDYGSKRKVRKNNKLADRLRKIPQIIEKEHPESKSEFYQLLFHEKASVRRWAAHHILEVMNYDAAEKKAALKEIKNISQHCEDKLEALGNKMWLENWYKEHPEDKLL